MINNETVTASLATIPGREESLKDTIESLLSQVDKINVYLHDNKGLPEYLQHPKIEVAFSMEWGNKGDLDKLAWCDEVKGWHLICDDDLIYPSDYVEHMIKKAEEYNRKYIIGLHGIVPFNPPIASYYQDRTVYSCLYDLPHDIEVPILGTGALLYHTDFVPLHNFNYENLHPNMCDVHLGIWAGANEIKMIAVAHKEGWLKHTNKIDMQKTIYNQTFNDDYIPTKYINDNYQFFKTKKNINDLPLVSIICINSRLRTNRQWVKEAFDSFRNQNYGNVEVVVVDNENKLITIGKAYNEGVNMSKGEYCLFVGDDDFISYDYVSTLVTYLIQSKGNPSIAGATSYLTMFKHNYDTNEITYEPRDLFPTGMWRKDWLIENPFCEYLTKYVDIELMSRADEMRIKYYPIRWHYGYFYRSHENQVSGHKLLYENNRSMKENLNTKLKVLRND